MNRAGLLLVLALVSACSNKSTTSSADAAATAAASGTDRAARLKSLLSAEHRRAAADVVNDDLTSRDPVVRRAAARALSRIADDASQKPLSRLIADEDPEVVAWAAYGLGYTCKGRESQTVKLLVVRAASLSADPPKLSGPLDPFASIADALGRCGNAEAEATLRAWLDVDEREESAALALGRVASRRKRLDDASIIALLDAASRPERPVAAALFAFTRVSGLPDPIQARLLEVATDALEAPPGARRSYAIRSLGRAGPRATEPLSKVLSSDAFSPSERADAAREIAKLGEPGQLALRRALAESEPKPDSRDKLLTAAWGPLSTMLDSLTLPVRDAKPLLERLTALEVPKNNPALERRVVTLRCRAASLLAGADLGFPKLVECDPDADGKIGRLALVQVVDRAKITGSRLTAWQKLAESKSGVVRQAAIELMPAHAEIRDPALVLARALRAPDAGTVAAAAQVIAAYPDRASEKPIPIKEDTKDDKKKKKKDGSAPKETIAPPPPQPVKPHPELVSALTSAFNLPRPPDSIEVAAALMGAASALQLLSFKPKLDRYCKSENPTLREHAEKALRVLGDQKRACGTEGPGPAPAELDHPPPEHATIVFETDAGELELTLDSALSPVTVERFIELARSGFFDGIVIHRVVPGFVVQLGDPGGDGYGGAGKPPLRCETSPISFEARRVGVALAGRDTGSSQLFVTLGPFPHLDGDYALIGRAEPGWDRVAQGDVVRKARVLP